MATCPSCGKELPGEFPFCPFCAAKLTEQPASALEERKVVSVLFCDLVGFTAASDRADPEDVTARLRPYHARLRDEIERYGGTVEKFVGDAVMAVFGAPVAHEDDAERAVRAGLRTLEAIAELNEQDPVRSYQVRVGINTGEAVVVLGARPEQGEGIVTGDVVNTASRLQGAAPVNGIAVSEQTYRATERVFEYESLGRVEVKGKAEPLAIWRPLEARVRLGADLTRTHATALIGRERETTLLIGTFEEAAQQRSCQLVTLVGEPGVGKSRLCTELLHHIEAQSEPLNWRQGRCLPYGDGIAFWALGEIVKAECGIFESDSPEQAVAKLDRALPEGDPDLPWLKGRLAPLVGVGGEPVSLEESFAAWRRFCELLAAQAPTVLVFEDLHWADTALLSFLEHLADLTKSVPLLLLCTARPELYEQHPAWAAGLANATTISLAPLTDEDTAILISSLLDRAVLPEETQQVLLERAGGNPLYAEEFVRLVADRSGLDEAVEVPVSVQALIAARLDTLSQERKSLLQDAAVIGKVFWAGALAEMGSRDSREVEQALHELARKELVRPAHTSSMDGEAEYGFWHVLVRDVCYAQIPRAVRAARHQAAGAWLVRKAGRRVDDLADVLAHHYVTALELARAAGHTGEAQQLEALAIRYLALAGQRALGLDVERVEQNFARALELAPAGHPQRASLLERWAHAAQQQGRLEEAKAALEETLALYRDHGKNIDAGRVLIELTIVLWRRGDPRREEAITEALTLLEAEPPGPELVDAYARLAGIRIAAGAYRDAIDAAERALVLAAELDLPEPARALGNRGLARCNLGERQGLEDLRRALALALDRGQGYRAAIQYLNLAAATWEYEGPQPALAVCQEGVDHCDRRGISSFVLIIAGASTTFLAQLGRAEEALAQAEPVAERLWAAGHINFVGPRSVQLRLQAERGEHEHAPAAGELVARARESGEPQMCALAFAAAARLLVVLRRPREAQALMMELERVAGTRTDPYYASLLPELVRTALAVEDPAVAARLVDGIQQLTPLAEHVLTACRAQLAEANGEYAEAESRYSDAATRWHEFGDLPERAYALLGQGRCLIALGDAGAEVPLVDARDLFASMGYKPALGATEKLLAGVAHSSSRASFAQRVDPAGRLLS